MKLEIKSIRGEETAFIVLDCVRCGEGISVAEREMKTTIPLTCSQCSFTRFLTYREYTLIADRFGAQLLEFTAVKFGGVRHRTSLNTCR